MNVCYHGNYSVAMATKNMPFASKNSTNWQVATPLTRPSERVKALALYTVYIFYYILHLLLNINETVHVGKSAHRLTSHERDGA